MSEQQIKKKTIYECAGSALYFEKRILKIFIGGHKKYNEKIEETAND